MTDEQFPKQSDYYEALGQEVVREMVDDLALGLKKALIADVVGTQNSELANLKEVIEKAVEDSISSKLSDLDFESIVNDAYRAHLAGQNKKRGPGAIFAKATLSVISGLVLIALVLASTMAGLGAYRTLGLDDFLPKENPGYTSKQEAIFQKLPTATEILLANEKGREVFFEVSKNEKVPLEILPLLTALKIIENSKLCDAVGKSDRGQDGIESEFADTKRFVMTCFASNSSISSIPGDISRIVNEVSTATQITESDLITLTRFALKQTD